MGHLSSPNFDLRGSPPASIGVVLSESGGQWLGSPPTANVKHSWYELSASSPFDASGIIVHASHYSGFNANNSAGHLIDIGIGAAGSEIVLIPDLMFSAQPFGKDSPAYYFPISIPAGSRIAARQQCSAASSDAVHVMAHLLRGPKLSAGKVEACGVVTADSGGTSIDPGATANTKGSYTTLIASTAFDYKGIIMAHGTQQTDRQTYHISWLTDLAVGPAGSEQIVFGDWWTFIDGSDNNTPGNTQTPFIPLTIPAGSRLSARCQSNQVAATIRLIDVAVWGVG